MAELLSVVNVDCSMGMAFAAFLYRAAIRNHHTDWSSVLVPAMLTIVLFIPKISLHGYLPF